MIDRLPGWMQETTLRSRLPAWMNPPPKKKALDPFGVNSVLQPGIDKVKTLLKSAGSQAVDLVKGELKSRHPFMGMVGPGELGAGELEKIVAAAIKAPDGRVFKGITHAHAFDALEGTGSTADAIAAQMGRRSKSNRPFLSEGFVTNTGRYVDRKEGLALAKAAKQTTETGDRGVSELIDMTPGPVRVGGPQPLMGRPGNATGMTRADAVLGESWNVAHNDAPRLPAGYSLVEHPSAGKIYLTDTQGNVVSEGRNPEQAIANLHLKDGGGRQIPGPAGARRGAAGAIPPQDPLRYYIGARTKDADLEEARQLAYRAFRPKGPYGKLAAIGEKVKGGPNWYDTREGAAAAEATAPGTGANQWNEILNMMAASTALSQPKSNLKRGIMWSTLARKGELDPAFLRSNKLFEVPAGFGHIAQRKLHQKGVADVVEFGGLNPKVNPKPSSFGGAGPHGTGNLGMNWRNATLDKVMSELAVKHEPGLARFFNESSPKSQFYQPLTEGFSKAAEEAAKLGRVPLPDPKLHPSAAWQSMGWMGTPNANNGSFMDVFHGLVDESAKMWGVSREEAMQRLFKDQKPLLAP